MRLGGATPLGSWGYIEAFKEMIEQGIFDNIDDIVVCLATGGTGCGLMIANYMTGSKIKLHGVCVKARFDRLVNLLDDEIEKVGLKDEHGSPLCSSELIDHFEHIQAITQDDMKYLIEVSTQTGIVLDTTFTLPAMVGMMREMRENPGRFKGHRVLFIHTGGLYEMQSVEMDEMLLATPETNRVYTIDNFIDI
jgi:1-aminocyclopropane-1-carboxylate deaminase/D-cysteine desulfhydrase-like pyridoxal-dependent ACC family enzyme